MTKTRVGIIGLGMAVGPHAKSLIDLADGIEVAGVFSPSRERREAFAARFAFPLAEDLDAILADRSVDAVLLLTPPNTHLDLVERAANAGKHVLLEKPVEISLARAEATVAACRKAGVTLGIVLQHRFRKPVERLGEILASGRLGRMVGASADVRNWRPQSYYDVPGRGTYARDGGGVLFDAGDPHARRAAVAVGAAGRGRGLRRHHAGPSHGGGGHGGRGDALRRRRHRDDRRHDRGLSRPSGSHRHHRREGGGDDFRTVAQRPVPRRAARNGSRTTVVRPAAAAIPWRSTTAPTGR